MLAVLPGAATPAVDPFGSDDDDEGPSAMAVPTGNEQVVSFEAATVAAPSPTPVTSATKRGADGKPKRKKSKAEKAERKARNLEWKNFDRKVEKADRRHHDMCCHDVRLG